MLRHAKYDPAIDAYSVSAFLIAQISKNYALPKTERMSGQKLIELTLSVIEDIQQQIGGGVVFPVGIRLLIKNVPFHVK